MMLENVLSKCDNRYEKPECGQCEDCSYGSFCPHDCEKCLDYIIQVMRLLVHLKENTIALIWQIFILANIPVGILLKLCMRLKDAETCVM